MKELITYIVIIVISVAISAYQTVKNKKKEESKAKEAQSRYKASIKHLKSEKAQSPQKSTTENPFAPLWYTEEPYEDEDIEFDDMDETTDAAYSNKSDEQLSISDVEVASFSELIEEPDKYGDSSAQEVVEAYESILDVKVAETESKPAYSFAAEEEGQSSMAEEERLAYQLDQYGNLTTQSFSMPDGRPFNARSALLYSIIMRRPQIGTLPRQR